MNRIVAKILEEFSKDNNIEPMDEADRFEYLSAYLTIRRHYSRALNLKDVIVGDGGDTGVDAIGIIVNGSLMTDVDQVQEMLDQNGYLEATFIFVQAERSASFDGAKIGTIGNGVEDFFRDAPRVTQNDNVKDAAEIKAAIYDRASSFRRRSWPQRPANHPRSADPLPPPCPARTLAWDLRRLFGDRGRTLLVLAFELWGDGEPPLDMELWRKAPSSTEAMAEWQASRRRKTMPESDAIDDLWEDADHPDPVAWQGVTLAEEMYDPPETPHLHAADFAAPSPELSEVLEFAEWRAEARTFPWSGLAWDLRRRYGDLGRAVLDAGCDDDRDNDIAWRNADREGCTYCDESLVTRLRFWRRSILKESA